MTKKNKELLESYVSKIVENKLKSKRLLKEDYTPKPDDLIKLIGEWLDDKELDIDTMEQAVLEQDIDKQTFNKINTSWKNIHKYIKEYVGLTVKARNSF